MLFKGLVDGKETKVRGWINRSIEDQGKDASFNEAAVKSLKEGELRKLGARKLRIEDFTRDPYYQALKGIKKAKSNGMKLTVETHEAYRPFLYDEEKYVDGMDFSMNHPFGYFDRDYVYPSVSASGETWMSLYPHEITTMRRDAERLHGRVLVLGLGLGYMPYLLSLKDSVREIVIVEIEKGIIDLFIKNLLPRFTYPEKVKIVHEDAFEYLKEKDLSKFDTVYADLWRNEEDGIPLYARLLPLLKDKKAVYWIEGSLIAYTRWMLFTLLFEQLEFGEEDLNYDPESEETLGDAIINQVYLLTKGKNYPTLASIREFLSDASIREMLPKLKL